MHLNPIHRNLTVAIVLGVALGIFAIIASRPAVATDPPAGGQPTRRAAIDTPAAESYAKADSGGQANRGTGPSDPAGHGTGPRGRANGGIGPRAPAQPAVPDSSVAVGPGSGRDTASDAAAEPAPLRFRAGEDPAFAESMGWPVNGPAPRAGSILPERRIIAYYGNPLSKRMGVLGEYAKDEMLRRFEAQLEEWRRADPDTPVQPALHLIAVVAQGDAGPSGGYRTIMRDTLVEQVYAWAHEVGAILFLDIQVGLSDIRELLPRFDHFLERPDVHLAIDPEFMMKEGRVPGTKIGTMDAADINYAAEHLAGLVRRHDLPPKVLVIHRFTRNMVTNANAIELRPEVQIVMHMDGWGASWLKRDSYKDYIVREPVQFTGFKLFYHNDTKAGDPLMTPEDVLRLRPVPLYIQYQ